MQLVNEISLRYVIILIQELCHAMFIYFIDHMCIYMQYNSKKIRHKDSEKVFIDK